MLTLKCAGEPIISVLGGRVRVNGEDPTSLSTQQWDLVFAVFEGRIPWHFLPWLCLTFSDSLHLNQLLVLGRYGEDWKDKKNILRVSVLGVHLGFLITAQSHYDPSTLTVSPADGGYLETETYNWVTGRMRIDDPLAELLLNELRYRLGQLWVVAWKGSDLDISPIQVEKAPVLKRTRRAKSRSNLVRTTWTTELDVSFIQSYLRNLRSLTGEAYEDYWQFAVIDNIPNQPSQLVHTITDALRKLKDYAPFCDIHRNLVEEVIPQAEQKWYRDHPPAMSTL